MLLIKLKNVFTEPLPSNGHMRHSIYIYIYIYIYIVTLMYFIIIDKTTLFEPQLFLEDSARFVDRPVFTSLDFATVIFLRIKAIIPASNPPTWRTRSLYLCPPVTGWPSYTPGTGFRFPRLVQLAGLWRCSNLLPRGEFICLFNNTAT
jgi:hypothetical protein